MKHRVWNTIRITCVIAVLFLAGGCSGRSRIMDNMNKSSEGAERIREEALAYLAEQYDDNFTITLLESAGISMDYDRLTVLSDAYPGESFYVNRYVKDGEELFRDNYFTLYMRRDAEQFFSDMAKQVKEGTSVQVKLKLSVRPETMTAQSTFADMVSLHGSTELYIYLYHKEAFSKAEQDAFLEALKEAECSASIIFEQQGSGGQQRYMLNREMKLYQF